ncbi:multiheme c-type cytochrome [Sorangium sp. So ce1128]
MKHAALALALWMGAFAGACGSATPPPETAADKDDFDGESSPGDDSATAGSESAKPAKSDKTASKDKDAEADEGDEDEAPAKSTPIQATKFEADLKKIGINLKKIPELEKLPTAQKKKVMPLLQKALGYDTCQSCHAEGDFKKETRDMKVAREMWRHFVVPLRSESGGTLFCDSCHAGNEHVLNRKDKKALQAFMEEEYQNKLARANKEDMECGTCHGDAMETKIIEKLWNIPE